MDFSTSFAHALSHSLCVCVAKELEGLDGRDGTGWEQEIADVDFVLHFILFLY